MNLNNKYFICIILYIFIILYFIYNYKVEKLTSQYDYYSPRKAIDSRTPTVILFYDGSSKSRLSPTEKNNIEKKNELYIKEFDAASENSTLPFYKLDISQNLTKSIWGKRLPSFGPQIIFYNNPSNGAKRDGRDVIKKYRKNDILYFLENKVRK